MTIILQANVHRSLTADSLLTKLVVELRAEIVIVSEQYRDKDGPNWIPDLLRTAAVWIPDTRKFLIERKGAERGFAWVKSGRLTVVSIYLTPNESIEEFHTKLEDLEDFLNQIEGDILVAGDFNARGQEWGMPTTDSRGRQILEMAARRGLYVANVGDTPTFRRPGQRGTIPDVTFATGAAFAKIKNWRVIEDYTGSDHQYIVFDLEDNQRALNQRHQPRAPRWNLNRLNADVLKGVIEEGADAVLQVQGTAETKAEATMQLIRLACDSSMPRTRGANRNRDPVYWWTEEIAALRRRCLQLRRIVTRGRRRRNAEPMEDAIAEFRNKRSELKRAINSSKRERWEDLRRDVNSDPWGLGYKIVTRKLGAQMTPPVLSEEKMEHIVETLFPTHPVRPPDNTPVQRQDIPLFSEEELSIAVQSLQNRRAPGPDGIPTEVLKVTAQACPQLLLNMFNSFLEEGVFPKSWKKQRLVLISKGKGDPNSPSAYRPLCMLDTAGKLLEKLLKPRLSAAVQASGDLSERQYGFRRGRSTIGAIQEVVHATQIAQQRNQYSKAIVLLATLDVRNAFNSARWSDILHALEWRFHVPAYLLRMVKNYLRDRELIYDTTEGPRRKEVTSGAAQGSILGPDLWNISYDDILRMEMPDDAFLVGYADDIAAVITARDTDSAQRKLNQVMRRTNSWMEEHGLSLATEKTEIVLLTRKRIPTQIDFQIGAEVIRSSAAVKYLGLRLDTKLTYWQQIKAATERASKTTTSLSRLMANVGGPMASKRRLLMATTHSILLYGSEIWADALRQEKYRKQMAAVQRCGALRVASSYRTVSEPAVLVIAGVTPIDLLAIERKYVHDKKAEMGVEAASEEAKQLTIQKWQERWCSESRGRWTARLIRNVAEWKDRKHGEVNYYVTQLLTGHGYFNAFLHRIGKTSSPACQYGDSQEDDAQHTFFACSRWTTEREALQRNIGIITPENIVDKMLATENNWNMICTYTNQLLRTKKREEEEFHVPNLT